MSKSSIITDPDWLPNPTPGEILLEEFLRPLDLSQTALARALRVPPRRIDDGRDAADGPEAFFVLD